MMTALLHNSYGRYGEDPVFDSSGLEALARWPGLARLRSLALSGNEIEIMRTRCAQPSFEFGLFGRIRYGHQLKVPQGSKAWGF